MSETPKTIEEAIRLVQSRWRPLDLLAAAGLEFPKVNDTLPNTLTWCPYHQDNNESFSVHKSLGLFHCFGCSKSGTLFQLLGHLYNLPEDRYFMEVLRRLGDLYGVTVPKTGAPHKIELAIKAYSAAASEEIWNHQNVLSYLEGRGIDAELVDRHSIGYVSPGLKIAVGGNSGLGWGDYESAGIFYMSSKAAKWYPAMQNRITIPIFRGSRPVNIVGRIFGDNACHAKYLNLRGREKVPWGISSLSKDRPTILVEGVFDAILSTEAGHPAIAHMGVDSANLGWLELLPPESDVTLALDADAAGVKATRLIGHKLLTQGIYISVIPMTEGLDPSDIIKTEGGREAWTAMVEQSIPWPVWAVRSIPEGERSFGDTQKALAWAFKPLSQIPNAVYQYKMIEEMAEALKVPASVLGRYMRNLK